jgi:hypothetical protein
MCMARLQAMSQPKPAPIEPGLARPRSRPVQGFGLAHVVIKFWDPIHIAGSECHFGTDARALMTALFVHVYVHSLRLATGR